MRIIRKLMVDEDNQQPCRLTLEQFCSQIKYVVEQNQIESWVTAEVAQVNKSRGHYYIELVQKSEISDMPSAKLKCNIWAGMVEGVLSPFWRASGGDIEAGIKILTYIRATFHPVFGLSGLIIAIDPNYTLGDLEARRRAIWERLQSEGVADMNKSLSIPAVIQRIAVISARTAAGFGDFQNQLSNNGYGITFHTELFEATVQGAEAEASIVQALDRVADRVGEFDIVVIIRGGGSKMDLACFDSYEVACNIAQFPLPVVTGIGHERDHSIADMVAHTAVKTPTAAAEFIIGIDVDFLGMLTDMESRIIAASGNAITAGKSLIENLSVRLLAAAKGFLLNRKAEIESLRSQASMAASRNLAIANQSLTESEMRIAIAAGKEVERRKMWLAHTTDRITDAASHILEIQQATLDGYAQRIKTSDPRSVIARGFSMTTDSHGMPLTSVKDVEAGETIVTHMSDGAIKSVVSN